MGAKETLVQKFRRKAFALRTIAEMQDKTASGHDMRKVLGAFDLLLLGIGCIIGAGIVVLTGVAAHKYAGPGVVLSYALSAVAAMLTSFCYAEYAAEVPIAGGAFNYVGLTFGEFGAWVAACDLILEYTLSAAAVAKGFTAYLAQFIGVELTKLRLQASIFTLDFPALLAVIVMSLLLARSTKESSLLNSIVVAAHLLLILFVLFAGFPFVKSENYTPFLPFGIRGCFTGASVVFFSFIGFDTVATAAEETRNPGRDLPIGIIGSLSICTILYVLMCLVITGMQPYNEIDLHAPFSVAFQAVGLGWADRIVAGGALTGIATSLLGSLLGQARIYVTLGRQHLLPAWLAKVSPSTGTPVNATYLTMFTAGSLALFLDIEVLAELVSIGTLVVFAMVCAGVLLRRYYIHGSGEPLRPIWARILVIVITSIAFSLSFTERAPVAVPVIFLVLWLAATASFLLLPVRYTPVVFKCPLSPWLPSFGVLCCLHLIGSLGWPAYVRWIVWFILGSSVYLFYSMHHTQGEGKSRQVADTELAAADGMTRPALGPCHSPSDQVEAAGDWVLLPAGSVGGKGGRVDAVPVSGADDGEAPGRPASAGVGKGTSSSLAGLPSLSTGPASSSMPALSRAAAGASGSPVATSGGGGAGSSFKQVHGAAAGGSEGSLLLAERLPGTRGLASPASTGHLGDAALPGAEGAHKRSRHSSGAGSSAGGNVSGVHHVHHVPHVRNDDVHASLIETD